MRARHSPHALFRDAADSTSYDGRDQSADRYSGRRVGVPEHQPEASLIHLDRCLYWLRRHVHLVVGIRPTGAGCSSTTYGPGRSTTANASPSTRTSTSSSPPSITRLIEDRTGWSLKKFVRTARRYRTVQIRAGSQIITAADPLPAELRDAFALIN